jgi:hypothetical protein
MKPVAFFMVVLRRSLFTHLFGWLLPRKVTVILVNRKGRGRDKFDAKVGSVYTCDSRDVGLDMGRLTSLYRLYKFRTLSAAKAYCRAQGLSESKLRGMK